MEGGNGCPHISGNKPVVGLVKLCFPLKAVERNEGTRLGFWSPNCYHHVLSYSLEDILVSDINNPELALNGLQVNKKCIIILCRTFESNI